MSKAKPRVLILIACCLAVSGCSVFGTKVADDALSDDVAVLMTEQHILETRLSLTEDRVLALQSSMDKLLPSAAEAKPAEAAPREPKQEKSVQPTPSGAGAQTAEAAYRAALAEYRAGKYAQAETSFKNFSANYPKSSLQPNAGYWLGECYYSQRRYDDAIVTFQSVAAKYPKHHKAAASLLKTGYAYERLADKPNARFYLQQLLENYPKSEPVPLARAALNRL